MVAHLLRLKLTLLRNGLRRSPWQLVGMAFGGLYALGLVGTLGGGPDPAARQADPELAQTVVVLGGAAALLGWGLIPVVASAADMTLDPARFTTSAMPMPPAARRACPRRPDRHPRAGHRARGASHRVDLVPRPPARGRRAGGCRRRRSDCIVLSKVVTTATASLASSRRFKDVSAIAFMIPLVLMGPIVAGVARGISASGGFLPDLAGTLSWTPLGAAWSLGGDARRRAPGSGSTETPDRRRHPRRPCLVLETPAGTGPGHPALRRQREPEGRKAGPVRPPAGDPGRRRHGAVPDLLAARSPLRRLAGGRPAAARAARSSKAASPGFYGSAGYRRPADGFPAGLVHLRRRLL